NWCSCRAGDCREFRWWTIFRLHGLWRYGQRRCAAGGCQQILWYPRVRQFNSGGESEGFLWAANRRSHVARQERSNAGIRAVAAEEIRKCRDEELSGGICKTSIGRRCCDGGICGACRELSRGPARQLSPQATPERGKRHANSVTIMWPWPVRRLFFPPKLTKMTPHSYWNPLR